MPRLGVINLDQLPPFDVLEKIDTEKIITDRMTRLKAVWAENDPPAAAQYDVDALEFDPIRINQEASTFFELLLRDRVNQAARNVTLAFATGGNLDAIGSRYPGGMPRLAGELDDHYRLRLWLSPNTLSPHGVYESYVFWALNADPLLRDVQALATPGSPYIRVVCMADGTPVAINPDSGEIVLPMPNPSPSNDRLVNVANYIADDGRKGLTDVVTVVGPRIVPTTYNVMIWLYPGWDKGLLWPQLKLQIANLLESQRWLGFSHTLQAIEAALKIGGVFNVRIVSPAADVLIDADQVVNVTAVDLIYAGRGGIEALSGATV